MAVGLTVGAASRAVAQERDDVTFVSRGVRLSGTLVFPSGGRAEAAVVFVHGSGPMRRSLAVAERFASQGIAALVYDKRGIGRSGGVFVGTGAFSETNLRLLADDAVAALTALRTHQRLGKVPVGLVGLSQAGWIVPLAAAQGPAPAFIGMWSGCVCKVSEEDIYSQYTSDRDFADRPTFEQVLKLRSQPYTWESDRFGKDTDASESLRRLDVPGLWIFGGRDGSIPVDLSIARLQRLEADGRDDYEYALFSSLGHALVDETFPSMVAWIKRVAGRTAPRRAAVGQAGTALGAYLGTYTSTNPRIEIALTGRGDTLVLESRGARTDLTRIGTDAFYGHDVGKGYFFLDFDPAGGRVTISETGFMYTLRKR